MEEINFSLFTVFLLATTGLTFITNRSKVFQPVREWVKDQYVKKENDRLMHDKKSWIIPILWWANEVLGCYMCASMYTGTLMAIVAYLSTIFPYVVYVMYPFASVPIVTIIIQYYVKTERK